MILGGYRNPPYRLPTPTGATSAGPPHDRGRVGSSNRKQSPKRKRPPEQQTTPPAPVPALRIDTEYHSDSSVENGPHSPRSKVAERLNRLEISRPVDHVSPASSPSPRKKVKRSPRARRPGETPDHHGRVEMPERLGDRPPLFLEMGETPARASASGADARGRTTSPTPAAPSPAPAGADSSPPARQKRMLSPPPPSPALTDAARTLHPSCFRSHDTSSSLTWQDSEITGHEITSPDDDGEGINGIGFKPTPAMAQVRSQKRRQQVLDWKARETREARQKRMDRRRGGMTGAGRSAGEEYGNRHVRFSVNFA